MRASLRSGALLAGLLGLQACSVMRVELGQPLDVAAYEEFESGLTTRTEVLESLGPPTRLGEHAHGVALVYEHIVLEENQLGLSLDNVGVWLGARGLGLFKVALGESAASRAAAVFVFDEAGVLELAAAGDWSELFGRGGGLQLFFAVEPVVNSADLRQPYPSLSWGRRLLDPPLLNLNRTHVADVELHNTPTDVGQRSLERRAGVD